MDFGGAPISTSSGTAKFRRIVLIKRTSKARGFLDDVFGALKSSGLFR
jgi:hypothetical protein